MSWRLIYAPNYFSKNCTNTETYSFADIYAIRSSDEGNKNSLPAQPWLTLVLYKH